jgi:hypothetical protein
MDLMYFDVSNVQNSLPDLMSSIFSIPKIWILQHHFKHLQFKNDEVLKYFSSHPRHLCKLIHASFSCKRRNIKKNLGQVISSFIKWLIVFHPQFFTCILTVEWVKCEEHKRKKFQFQQKKKINFSCKKT